MPLTNPGAIDANLTLIPDEAEVWLALKSSVTDIAAMIPETATEDLGALGWLHTGLVDDAKGIPLDPSIEVKEYDAFGHPSFRVKLKKGKLKTGFTALERNEVTKKIVLPGSAPNKIGAPKDVQVYVLYRYVDEDRVTVWVQLTPAPVELKSLSGIIDGELGFAAEMTVHHTTDAAGDVFQVVDASTDDVAKTVTIPGGVTAYTMTVNGTPTASVTLKTASALQSALRAIATVQALPAPGATVTGPDGGPLAVNFTGPVTVTATGTGGTVVVA